jgi:Lrp/AsnC family transcriptional regulator, leucine-responsive regulatory protein
MNSFLQVQCCQSNEAYLNTASNEHIEGQHDLHTQGDRVLSSMTRMKSERFDPVDLNILVELQTDAQIPFAELGRRIGLSTPSVTERVHKLEESGTIVGYHAEIRPERIGLSMGAFIKVTIAGDRLDRFGELAKKTSGIRSCHRVTGAKSYILHVAVKDAARLESMIDSLMPYIATNTSIILASPITWAPLRPFETKLPEPNSKLDSALTSLTLHFSCVS